jgi:hypothetical protein
VAGRLSAWLCGLLLAGGASAQCEFDAFGTITNPQDPSCGGRELRYTRSGSGGDEIPLGYDVPIPVDSLTPVDGFRTYRSLFERHQSLDAEHATVAGAIVGRTLAGRDIWAYRVGDEDELTADGAPEPAALINGTIHAREWQSPEAVTALFEHLVERQGDDGLGSWLRDNLNVVILPVLNVDGFLTTQKYPDRVTGAEVQPREGRQRRKNLRDPTTSGPIDDDVTSVIDNFWGVDLNRNTASGWGRNNGSSANPVALVYRGAAPASEPELAALFEAAAQLGPLERLRLYSDVHSFSQIFFTPLTGNARRDGITAALVGRMRAVLGNKYRWGPDSSSGIGLTADWFARTLQIPAWTLETEPLQGGIDYGGTGHGHSGFILPESEVDRMREEVVAMLVAGLYRQAGPPRLEAIKIRDAASGDVRYSARWKASPEGRRRAVAADLPLLPGRDYRLWLAFDRPMRKRNAAGDVVNYRGQSVPLSPHITVEFPTLGDPSVDVTAGRVAWLADPADGGDEGYWRYRDDALVAEFSVPADLPLEAPAPAVLAVAARDMLGAALDGDPATRVDWADGHWVGYEDVDGAATDAGGTDCKFIAFVATDAGAGRPAGANRTPCRAAAKAPDPGDPGGSSDGGGSSGGGGAALWLLALIGLVRVVGGQARR